MSIIRPTAGDLYDRLSILSLKMVAAAETGRRVHHFRREWDAIAEELTRRKPPEAVQPLIDDLDRVNGKLFHATAKLNEIETVNDLNAYAIAYLAFEVAKGNQRRSELKKEIDILVGDYEGDEKVYGLIQCPS